jgi:hypothetical protein
MKSFFIAPPVGGGRSRNPYDPPLVALRLRRCSSGCTFAPLEIGIQAIRLSPYRAGLAGRHLQRLPVAPAFPTGSFPLRLSPSGQSDDPGASLRAPPDCIRDSTPRSAAHSFQAYRSPVAGFSGGRLWVSHLPPSLLLRSTCPPSPCGRLSRSPTPMGAPSPWGSRPLGDLVVLGCGTSEPGLGRPLIPTPDVSSPVSCRTGLRVPLFQGNAHGSVTWSQLGDGSENGPIRIGLQAIQLWPCHAGLAGPRFADLNRFPLLRQALVRRTFRSCVSRMTQAHRPRASFLQKGYSIR